MLVVRVVLGILKVLVPVLVDADQVAKLEGAGLVELLKRANDTKLLESFQEVAVRHPAGSNRDRSMPSPNNSQCFGLSAAYTARLGAAQVGNGHWANTSFDRPERLEPWQGQF